MTDLLRHAPPGAVVSGVEALARLLLLRQELDDRDGLLTATLVSGYPGSPLGGFDLTIEQMPEALAAHRIVHRPGLNEELAAAAVWGSQMGAAVAYEGIDGVVGVWYGKTPGLDRCGDVLKHANAMGAGPNGGAVMFCGDDPTAKSSTLPCESQPTFADACIPVLIPGNQQEIVDLGIHAFRLSRYCGSWVGLKIVTTVADGIGTVDLDPERLRPRDPEGVMIDGKRWRHEPARTIGPHQVPGQEILVVDHRLQAARAYVRHNGLDRVSGASSPAPVGIVCAGKTYSEVIQAFDDLGVAQDGLAGVGVRVLKLAMTFPLVDDTIVEFAESVGEIVVIEEKRGFIEGQLRAILHEAGALTPVRGKRDRDGATLVPASGELNPTLIATILARVLPALAPAPTPPTRRATRVPIMQVPPRPPAFCSGCPHNRSTVSPEDALVGGGVGCHGIMYLEARHSGMKSVPPTPMGAEGVPWIGLSPFVAEPHLIQNLGDGTFSHSGSLAIRATVAAGVNITFKLLYNSAVAMTGGQDVTGLMDVPSLTRALHAEGVRRIVVCAEDPKRYGRRARWAPGVQVYGRDALPEAQEELRKTPGVTVIVYDQRCAAEARRLRKRGLLAEPARRVFINEAVCEGCGDCSAKSNCLSVLPYETEFGEKRQIHESSCNRDYTCLDGDCPSFVTLTPKRKTFGAKGNAEHILATASRAPSAQRPRVPSEPLPDPDLPPVDRRFSLYFTGIGGTGVVTANRIFAAAAEAAGFVIGGMDQTGLSQKAGAVVSHLHLAKSEDAVGSAVVSSEGADLYLSGDILQAANPVHLAKVRPGRTVAVIDSDFTPTAAMLQAGVAVPDPVALRAAIVDRIGDGRVVFIDSKRIAEQFLGNHLLANVVILGAAFQAGGIPVPKHQIDEAIDRQGAAAAANLEAFEWGRWAVHEPTAVAAMLDDSDQTAFSGPSGVFEPSAAALAVAIPLVEQRNLPDPLRKLLIRRAAQAIDYQGPGRARRFLDLVERAARADDVDHGWEFTRSVADAWFKLLTYKDEYEVARLHLNLDLDHVARQAGIDGAYRVQYHLHPPILRRLGMKKKLAMGKPYELTFHALRGLRRLRGTPFDVFGWDRDRRAERALIVEYEDLLRESLDNVPHDSYDRLVRLAESPMTIKGYGEIKERAVEGWRQWTTEFRSRDHL